MQVSPINSSSTHPNRKKRRRRAKRKNTQQQNQKSDEIPQSTEDQIQPFKESQKENGDSHPSKSVCASNEEIAEGSVKEGIGSPESQNRKKKRKRKRKSKKDTSHNESDSGQSNPNVNDYTGPYGELYLSISKKDPFKRYNEQLDAWYSFMVLLRYYISYYGDQNSKIQFKEYVKNLTNEILKIKLQFEDAQPIPNY
ncbi:hypothetical protein ACTXT7_001847 [Hymenolepis weldensis]